MVKNEAGHAASFENSALLLPLALSILEAAKLAGVSRATLYGEMAAKRLKSVKVGKRRLIPTDALRAWLDALPESTSA